MGESKRLVKNTGIIAIGGMATKLAQFLLLPLYTSILSTSEYGTVDYLNTIALFCVPAVSLLMDEAVFRFLIDCKTDEDRSRAVTTSCIVLFCGCILFSAGAFVIWLIFAPADLLWVVGLVISGTLLQMVSAVLRGFGKTPSYASMNFLASLLTIILNVIFIAVLRWGVVGMLSAYVIGQGSIAIAFFFGERTWRYIDPSLFSVEYARVFLKYSLPLIPNKVSWNIMNLLDRLIIMNVMGSAASGIYAVAYKFPTVMDTVYGFFYQSWKESSARALGSDEDEGAFYNRVYKALRRFMMAIVLGMTALMPLVYGFLVDSSYNEGLLYVPILLLATYFSNISGFCGGIFTAYRDTRIMGTTTVVSAVLCIMLCSILIPVAGLYGASIATLVATFLVNEYRRLKVSKYAELFEDRKEQAITFIAVLATFVLYYAYVYTGNIVALIVCLVISFIFFMGMNRNLIAGFLLVIRKRRGQ